MCKIIDYSEKAVAVIGNTKEKKGELKKLGGRFNAKLRCGAGWIFPKTKLKAIETFLNTGMIDLSTCKEKSEYRAKETAKIPLEKTYINANGEEVTIPYESMNFYKLPSGLLFGTERQSIKTRFWIGENGYDFSEKVNEASKYRTDERYFLAENMEYFNNNLKTMNEGNDLYLLTCGNKYFSYVICAKAHCLFNPLNRDEYEKRGEKTYDLTPEDKAFIIKIYEQEKANMEKRLKNYLKRYGLSKVSADTYWVDR